MNISHLFIVDAEYDSKNGHGCPLCNHMGNGFGRGYNYGFGDGYMGTSGYGEGKESPTDWNSGLCHQVIWHPLNVAMVTIHHHEFKHCLNP
jgi:hypothetical protein